MTRYFAALSILLFTLSVSSVASADDLTVMEGATLNVTKINSGHEVEGTLDDGTQVTVRVLGIDCLDTKAGEKARKLAMKLLLNGPVKLEGTMAMLPLQLDHHGRLVAYLRLSDGNDYSSSVLKQGQCTTAMWRIPHPRKADYALLANN